MYGGDGVDREKLGIYAEKYSKAVFRAAFCYVRNFADSEDIMQETFLRLYKSAEEFKTDENVKAWLIRVAINISKDFLKSSWIHRRDELNDGMIYDDERDKSLAEAMTKLKPDYRAAIYLHYYMGYSVKETAAIMGISETNAKARLKRGRDRLRDFLTDND